MSEVEYSVVDLGAVTAYAQAVENGYTGTLEQWAQLQINSANNYQELFNEIYTKDSSAALWEQGGLSASSGATSSGTTRIRTTDFLPDSVAKIVMNTGYYIMVYMYGNDGTFCGIVENDYDFSGDTQSLTVGVNLSYAQSCITGSFDLRGLKNFQRNSNEQSPSELYPYKYKIVAAFGVQGTTAITPSGASNITFYENNVGHAVDNDLIGIGENEPDSDRAVLWIDKDGATAVYVPEIDDDHVSDVDTWSSEKINSELGQLSEEFDNVRDVTANLLDMSTTAGWYAPRVDEDITLSIPEKDTIRITSNISQTYATAKYDIDVTGINTLYTSYSEYSGTGTVRFRLYTGSTYGTITKARKTWDVSEYNTVSVEIAASTSPAGTGYIDYKEILVTADSEQTEYVPRYIYEPYAHKVEQELDAFKTGANNSIISNNNDAINNLVNLKMYNNRTDSGVANLPPIVSLLHFSDLHADVTSLKRIVEFKTAFPNLVDDAICTGDMIYSHYNSSAMDFWDGISGAENIMMTIGNHDVWKEDATEFAPGNYITEAEAYTMYIADYVSNWNVTYTQGHTYYYKDYATAKLRLICLDMMLAGSDRTAQLTWLQNTLASAKTAGYSVVIAQHFAPRPNTTLPCNFSALEGSASTTEGWSPEATYMDAVESFRTGGGDFVCWLGGHTHCDYVCYDPSYPNQIFITVTCARRSDSYSDQARVDNTKSQDAFNLIAFDTYHKRIKIIRVGADCDYCLRGRNALTIDYTNKSIVASN